MSQTVVNDAPGQAYAGKVQYSGQLPTTQVSRIAGELIYFGKLVVVTGGQLTVGDQEVTLPTSAAEVLLAAKAGGVAIADPSVEAIDGADYGAFIDESVLPVMRSGAIWVQLEAAIADLADGVFVRVQNAGTIPEASLGSFTAVDTADHEPAPAGMGWGALAVVGGVNFGLLQINLPA